MQETLILTNLIVGILLSLDLLRKDGYFGVFSFCLLLYSIVGQFGYHYFPDWSADLRLYFGPECLVPSSVFTLLSHIGWWLIVRVFFVPRVHRPLYECVVVGQQSVLELVPPAIIAVQIGVVLYGNWIFRGVLNYNTAADEMFGQSQGPFWTIFLICFKFSVWISLGLYYIIRVAPKNDRFIRTMYTAMFVVELAALLGTAMVVGNRTDLLVLMGGIVALEVFSQSTKTKRLALLGVLAVGVLVTNRLSMTRTTLREEDNAILRRIVVNDYYPPVHMLFASVALDMVQPKVALQSVAANTVFLLGQPYIQAEITERFLSERQTRSASYAFYCFTEGYVVAGMWGVIYNAFVFGGLVGLWRMMAACKNQHFRAFVLALIIAQCANMVRGQSSYFVRTVYFYIIPVVAFVMIALRMKLVSLGRAQRLLPNRRGLGALSSRSS